MEGDNRQVFFLCKQSKRIYLKILQFTRGELAQFGPWSVARFIKHASMQLYIQKVKLSSNLSSSNINVASSSKLGAPSSEPYLVLICSRDLNEISHSFSEIKFFQTPDPNKERNTFATPEVNINYSTPLLKHSTLKAREDRPRGK